MNDDNCVIWHLNFPQVPGCSRLYHLAPAKIGTAETESLTSYIEFLADAHGVSARTLIEQVILPELGKTYLNRSFQSIRNIEGAVVIGWSTINNFLTHYYINGISSTATDWAKALERLTLCKDLHYLTLATWGSVLPWRGLLKKNGRGVLLAMARHILTENVFMIY